MRLCIKSSTGVGNLQQQSFFWCPPKAAEIINPLPQYGDLPALQQAAEACQACGLRAGCRGVVFGEGNPRARLLLIGEAPGATEDELGRPFVGQAGQLLDRILAAVGISRAETYITNICKCRPPGNRAPVEEEMATCFPFLAAQIALIQPKVLVCLGATAARKIIDPQLRITKARGNWYERFGLRVMPTFHPAALLRDPRKKRPVWEDFKLVRSELGK